MFITLFGLLYLNIFTEIPIISAFLFDFATRIYSLVIINSLNYKLKSDEKENELMNMQEMNKLSYGAIDDAKSTPSHHVTFTLDSSQYSFESDDLDESRDELRSMP